MTIENIGLFCAYYTIVCFFRVFVESVGIFGVKGHRVNLWLAFIFTRMGSV